MLRGLTHLPSNTIHAMLHLISQPSELANTLISKVDYDFLLSISRFSRGFLLVVVMRDGEMFTLLLNFPMGDYSSFPTENGLRDRHLKKRGMVK